MNTDPNPQGKGLVPVLKDVTACRPKLRIPPKKVDQITAELFTAMFILESDFSFKPVVGKTYYLYRKNGVFRLSLVGPDQWAGDFFGQFIGRCTLGDDITWVLEMDEQALQDDQLHLYIEVKKQSFEQALEKAVQLGDLLPVYCEGLPYYQRLFASALASSLGIPMELSGIKDLTYSQAKGLLEHYGVGRP